MAERFVDLSPADRRDAIESASQAPMRPVARKAIGTAELSSFDELIERCRAVEQKANIYGRDASSTPT